MKRMNTIGIVGVIGIMLLAGCAPSVTVIPAGQDKHYEVTVRSDELTLADTEELIQAWHQKASEVCNGNYRVLRRDAIQQGELFDEIVITGIVECQ